MKRTPELSKLISLARIARKRIEVLSEVEGGRSHLAGYCGIASLYLEKLANKEDIFPQFIAGEFRNYNRILGTYNTSSGHVWLELDEYIIDITSTQFRNAITKIDRNFNKKVYISKDSNPHYLKLLVGDGAKKTIRMWYVEPLEEICQKVDKVNA